jgi:hypothetical protein
MAPGWIRAMQWMIVILLPIGFVWPGTCWIRRRSARICSRLCFTPLCFVAFSVVARVDAGKWQCLVCGAMEERVICFGWALENGPPESVSDSEDSRPFERWYKSAVGTPHEHDWVRVGCHQRSNILSGGVACAEYPYSGYFHTLPSLDPKLAAATVERTLHATHQERRELLLRFGDR